MRQRLAAIWFSISDSLWFIPSALTCAAIVLALITVRVDQHVTLSQRESATWVFGGGAEGARGVLTAISGTMITVTGLVFSITIVALQLASSQFSPRLLRTFTGDRGNQLVMGVFIATFTYALLVLRSVKSGSQDQAVFVPAISVTVSIGLALLSIGCLIFYIHHATRSIQVSVIVNRASVDTLQLIQRVQAVSRENGSSSPVETALSQGRVRFVITSAKAGYVQSIAEEPLFELDQYGVDTVNISRSVGCFVLTGQELAEVFAATPSDAEDLADKATIDRIVRSAVLMGEERTLMDDVSFGFRQIADIALKALSPGINDPTTATGCIDRLAELLVEYGKEPQYVVDRQCPASDIVMRAAQPTFAEILDVSFSQIRHYGAADSIVMSHTLQVLGNMVELVHKDNRNELILMAQSFVGQANLSLQLEQDRVRVSQAATWIAATESRDTAIKRSLQP